MFVRVDMKMVSPKWLMLLNVYIIAQHYL